MSVPAEVRAAIIEILDAPDTVYVSLFVTTKRAKYAKSVVLLPARDGARFLIESATGALGYANRVATTDGNFDLANRADAALEALRAEPVVRLVKLNGESQP